MADNIKLFWNKNQKIISILIALIGFVFYIFRSWEYIHTIASVIMDESLYVYKGYLYASGKYTIYQEFGPWSNHLPLSFLIPGYVQVLFGPGIRIARYFIFFLGTTSIIAFWLVAKRLGGYWWGAIAVWVVSLNTMWVETFSFWTSQLLVHSLILWIFVFSLGEKRSKWELVVGGMFAGILGMTRVNLLPFIAIYILYVIWQNGWKKSLYFVLVFSGIFIAINAIYWPNILRFWSSWIPKEISPFLDAYRNSIKQITEVKFLVQPFFPISAWLKDPSHTAWNQIEAAFRALRWSFLPLISVIATLVLIPKRKFWKSDSKFKITVFLLISYIVSLGFHATVSLSGRSCSFYCIEYYMLFFNVLGLLAFISAYDSFKFKTNFWQSITIIIVVLLLLGGINYQYSTENKGNNYLTNLVLDAPFPRIKEGKFIGGSIPFMVILESKTNFNYNDYFLNDSKIANVISFIIIAGIILVSTLLLYFLLKRRKIISSNFIPFLLILILCFAAIFSPSKVFGGGRDTFQCEKSIFNSYEIAGTELAKAIPEGAQVYLNINASLIFLYTEDIKIYPSQINSGFSKMIVDEGIDQDELLSFGRWSQFLEAEWLDETEYVVIQGYFFTEEWENRIEDGEYELVLTTVPTEECREEDTRYWLLRKLNN